MNSIVTITNSALSKMKKISKITNNYAFLFSANSGGCNGFNYNIETIDKIGFDSLVKPSVIEKEDIKLAIEPLSEMLLIGTTIDYIKEDYNKNIYESKFVFIPDKNLATTCGCGVSFTPK